jgi:hypothetical protein
MTTTLARQDDAPSQEVAHAIDNDMVIRVFRALAAEFHPSEVKQRSQAGRQFSYITARVAMNRLDEVLLPHNWKDEYSETEKGIKCRIWFRLPGSSEWFWKEDGGAAAGMGEADNDEKSGYSDAFKRTAVKLGVARYLYKDGVPIYPSEHVNGEVPNDPQLSKPVLQNNSGQGKGPTAGAYASTEQVIAFDQWVELALRQINGHYNPEKPEEAIEGLWPKRWNDRYDAGRSVPENLQPILKAEGVRGHLLKWAVATERLDPRIVPEDTKPGYSSKYLAIIYARSKEDFQAMRVELNRYAVEKMDQKETAIFLKNPDMAPEGWLEEYTESVKSALNEIDDGGFVEPPPKAKRETKAQQAASGRERNR